MNKLLILSFSLLAYANPSHAMLQAFVRGARTVIPQLERATLAACVATAAGRPTGQRRKKKLKRPIEQHAQRIKPFRKTSICLGTAKLPDKLKFAALLRSGISVHDFYLTLLEEREREFWRQTTVCPNPEEKPPWKQTAKNQKHWVVKQYGKAAFKKPPKKHPVYVVMTAHDPEVNLEELNHTIEIIALQLGVAPPEGCSRSHFRSREWCIEDFKHALQIVELAQSRSLKPDPISLALSHSLKPTPMSLASIRRCLEATHSTLQIVLDITQQLGINRQQIKGVKPGFANKIVIKIGNNLEADGFAISNGNELLIPEFEIIFKEGHTLGFLHVMGHELSHILENDSTLSDHTHSPKIFQIDSYWSPEIAEAFKNARKYSRFQEMRADILSALLSLQICKGGIEDFDHLRKTEEPLADPEFSTHPSHEERYLYLKRLYKLMQQEARAHAAIEQVRSKFAGKVKVLRG